MRVVTGGRVKFEARTHHPAFLVPFNFTGLSFPSPALTIFILAVNCHAGEAAKALGIRH